MRMMLFETMPNWKTLYHAFVDYYNGKWWSDNIIKSYLAPARDSFEVDGGSVHVGDYVIHKNSFEYFGAHKPKHDLVEDVVRFPGSELPVSVHNLLAERDFYTNLTEGTTEIMTDGMNFFKYDRVKGLYDVESGENVVHGLYELFKNYLALADEGKINVGTDFIMFTRFIDEWEVIVRKYKYKSGVEVSVQSIYGGRVVREFVLDDNFFDVLGMVVSVDSILELLSVFI